MPQGRRSHIQFPMGSVNFSNLPNPSHHTIALGFTQALTEMSTRNLPGEKCVRHVRLTTLAPPVSCLETVGSPMFLNHMGLHGLLQG
jgi:hypothetical protein